MNDRIASPSGSRRNALRARTPGPEGIQQGPRQAPELTVESEQAEPLSVRQPVEVGVMGIRCAVA